MIKLQMGRWGDNWEDTPSSWPDEWLAREAFSKEDLTELANLNTEGRFWFRLVNEQGNVLEIWHPLPYVGSPYIAMLSANPFVELQEDYGLEDSEMIELCQRYLKAKGVS